MRAEKKREREAKAMHVRLFAVAVALHEHAEVWHVLTSGRMRLRPRRDQDLPFDAAHHYARVGQHRLIRVAVFEKPVLKALGAPSIT